MENRPDFYRPTLGDWLDLAAKGKPFKYYRFNPIAQRLWMMHCAARSVTTKAPWFFNNLKDYYTYD